VHQPKWNRSALGVKRALWTSADAPHRRWHSEDQSPRALADRASPAESPGLLRPGIHGGLGFWLLGDQNRG